jgi:flavin-dependent dehydrogenase
MTETDIVIIGAGTAGQTAAYDLIAEGYRVTVVEKHSPVMSVLCMAARQRNGTTKLRRLLPAVNTFRVLASPPSLRQTGLRFASKKIFLLPKYQ